MVAISLLVCLLAGAYAQVMFPCDRDSCAASTSRCLTGVDKTCFTHSPQAYYSNLRGTSAYSYGDGSTTPGFDPYNPCEYDPNSQNLRSECPICTDAETICHVGRCLALTQAVNAPCCTSPTFCHEDYVEKYCQAGLSCVATSGTNGTCEADTFLLPLGASCTQPDVLDPDPCASNANCGSTSTCVWDKGFSLRNCDVDVDCPFGQFCKSDVPNEGNRTCTSGDPTVGAECDVDHVGQIGQYTQCGHELICAMKDHLTAECIEPYSKMYGMPCGSSQECAPRHYCSSNQGFCEKMQDYPADCCGAQFTDACPPVSYGTSLTEPCQFNGVITAARQAYYTWNLVYKDFLACLQESGCQYVFDADITCNDACKTEEIIDLGAGKCSSTYTGYYQWSAASHRQVGAMPWLVVASVLAFFAQF